jgi:hypothetical protein
VDGEHRRAARARAARLALWLYGRLPLPAGPPWRGSLHRISGRLAFLASLPVAYHCLYQALGEYVASVAGR